MKRIISSFHGGIFRRFHLFSGILLLFIFWGVLRTGRKTNDDLCCHCSFVVVCPRERALGFSKRLNFFCQFLCCSRGPRACSFVMLSQLRMFNVRDADVCPTGLLFAWDSNVVSAGLVCTCLSKKGVKRRYGGSCFRGNIT